MPIDRKRAFCTKCNLNSSFEKNVEGMALGEAISIVLLFVLFFPFAIYRLIKARANRTRHNEQEPYRCAMCGHAAPADEILPAAGRTWGKPLQG